MIRPATQADIPSIVRLGSQSLVDGPYAGMLKDSPEHSAKLALSVIQASGGKILLYENDSGRVAGLLGFLIFPHYFTGEPTATEIMLYVEPSERAGAGGLKLIWEAEKQAKAMGATRIGFTAPNEEIGKLYEKCGCKKLEVTYMKEL